MYNFPLWDMILGVVQSTIIGCCLYSCREIRVLQRHSYMKICMLHPQKVISNSRTKFEACCWSSWPCVKCELHKVLSTCSSCLSLMCSACTLALANTSNDSTEIQLKDSLAVAIFPFALGFPENSWSHGQRGPRGGHGAPPSKGLLINVAKPALRSSAASAIIR